jgi:hypothetical protein
MKKVIKLTESDLVRLVKKVITEGYSKKGSLTDIAKKEFFHKSDFPDIYKGTQTPDFVWEVLSSRDGGKIAGSIPKEGTYFKSSDFIDLSNGGEISFVRKGDRQKIMKGNMLPTYSVDLGNNGIRMNAFWD